jgi:hypothetical protein
MWKEKLRKMRWEVREHHLLGEAVLELEHIAVANFATTSRDHDSPILFSLPLDQSLEELQVGAARPIDAAVRSPRFALYALGGERLGKFVYGIVLEGRRENKRALVDPRDGTLAIRSR